MVSRFWMTVDMGGDDACWPWKGYSEEGYGKFYDGDRMVGAHELAVRWSTGEIRLPELDTCHSCHNPICCNPAHLRYDTRQSNVDDAIRAERHARGVTNGQSKLTEEDVLLIRRRSAAGATGRLLASRYGMSESSITMIIRGKRWSHVGGPIKTEHGNRKHGRYAK